MDAWRDSPEIQAEYPRILDYYNFARERDLKILEQTSLIDSKEEEQVGPDTATLM